MANYPASAPSFIARSNGQTIDASHINSVQDEVVAIGVDLLAVLTQDGSVSALNATATTLFAATGPGRYEIYVYLDTGNDPPAYAAFATVVFQGSGARIVANNATNMTLTLSALNVQATQTSGTTQTINWRYLKIA